MAGPFEDFLNQSEQQEPATPFTDFLATQKQTAPATPRPRVNFGPSLAQLQAPPQPPPAAMPKLPPGLKQDQPEPGPNDTWDRRNQEWRPTDTPDPHNLRPITNYAQQAVNWYETVPSRAMDAAARLTRHVNPLDPMGSIDERMGDVGELGSSAMDVAMPLIPGSLASAPVKVGAGLVEGYLAGKGSEWLARKAGLGPGGQQLANVVGGGIVGGRELLKSQPPEVPRSPFGKYPESEYVHTGPDEPPPPGPPGAPAAAAPPPPVAPTEPPLAATTAATPTVPQSEATYTTQLAQLANGERNVVMVEGRQPITKPEGMRLKIISGKRFFYNPLRVSGPEITQAFKQNELSKILGPADGGIPVEKAQIAPNEPPVAVVGRDPQGTEAESMLTDEQHLQQTVQQTEKLTPPGGTVSVEPPEKVIGERLQTNPETNPPGQPVEAPNVPVPANEPEHLQPGEGPPPPPVEKPPAIESVPGSTLQPEEGGPPAPEPEEQPAAGGGAPSDSQNPNRLPGDVGVGQEPLPAQPQQGPGSETPGAGGVLQEPRQAGVEAQPAVKSPPVEAVPAGGIRPEEQPPPPEPAPEPAPAPVEKQPWQKTRAEAGVGEPPVIPESPRPLSKTYGKNWEQRPDAAALKKDRAKIVGARSRAMKAYKQYVERSNAHLRAVQEAVAAGQPVPPEVLGEYRGYEQRPTPPTPSPSRRLEKAPGYGPGRVPPTDENGGINREGVFVIRNMPEVLRRAVRTRFPDQTEVTGRQLNTLPSSILREAGLSRFEETGPELQYQPPALLHPNAKNPTTILHGNSWVTELLQQVIGTTGFKGFHLKPEQISGWVLPRIEALQRIPDNRMVGWRREGLEDLRAAFQNSADEGAGFVYVDHQGGAGTLRHEVAHAIQQAVLGSASGESHVNTEILFRHPVVQKFISLLERQGYPRNPAMMADEIGAHLIHGTAKLRSRGLTNAEAKQLARAYGDALIERHGPEVREWAQIWPVDEGGNIRYERDFADDDQLPPPHGEGVAGEARPVGEDEREPGAQRPVEFGAEVYGSGTRPYVPAGGEEGIPGGPGQESIGSASGPPPDRAPLSPTEQFLADESGSASHDILGVEKSYKEDIKPGAESLLSHAASIWDDVKSFAAPALRGEAATASSHTVREMGANIAMYNDRAKFAVQAASKYFSTQPKEMTRNFMIRMERGLPQLNPDTGKFDPRLQQFANTFRKLLDDTRNRAQKLPQKVLQNYYDNYFPHSWKDPLRVGVDMAAARAAGSTPRGPLTGLANFLKMRKIPSIAEGLEWGYEPLYENPADMVIHKVGEMNKFIAGMEAINEEKAAGRIKFFKIGSDKLKKANAITPGKWVKINDKMSTVYRRGPNGEPILAGNYYALEPVANIFNKYLSPGLRGRPLYDAAMGVASTMNQFNLGLSGFHAGFTTKEAMTSRLSLMFRQLTRGDFGKAGRSLVETPFAPITNIRLGQRLGREWNKPGAGQVASTNRLVQLIDRMSGVTPQQIPELLKWAKAGGARYQMEGMFEKPHHEKAAEAFKRAWMEATGPFPLDLTKIIGPHPEYAYKPSIAKALPRMIKGAWEGIRAGVEATATPIMKWLVPNQKLGALANILQYEIERNPNATQAQIRALSAQAQDVIDERFGQVVYHNWHLDNRTKDALQVTMRSPGWVIGTIKTLGGAVENTGTAMKKLVQGKATAEDITHRMTNLPAMVIIDSIVGAIFMKAMAGLWPRNSQDIVAPLNGGVDANGNPSRSVQPGYGAQAYQWTHHPIDTALGKENPLPALAQRIYQNKTWSGTKIYNEEDNPLKKVKDVAVEGLKEQLPFSFQNWLRGRNTEQGGLKNTALSVMGFANAPAEFNKTPAQVAMSRIIGEDNPQGLKTTQESDRYAKIAEFVRATRLKKNVRADIQQAVRDGVIRRADVPNIYRRAKVTPFVEQYTKLSFERKKQIDPLLTPEERAQVQKGHLMQKSIDTLSDKPDQIRPDTQQWIIEHGYNYRKLPRQRVAMPQLP